MTQLLDKRCLGYHCQLRDRCKHHFANHLENFFQSVERGEACHHFESVHNEYGRRLGDEDND